MYLYGMELDHFLLPKSYPIVHTPLCMGFFPKTDILLNANEHFTFFANQ